MVALLAPAMTLGCQAERSGVPGEPGSASEGGSGVGLTGSGGAGAMGGAAVGGAGVGGGLEPDGSWAAPFVIDELPATVDGDTTMAVSSEASSYWPCAPDTDEGGPEVVYRLTIDQPGWLDLALDDAFADVDVDVQLLAELTPDACITRGHLDAGAPVQPGNYWVVVDTWVDGEDTALAGPYSLTVSLVTETGSNCLEPPIACTDEAPPFVNMDFVQEPGDPGCPDGMARVDDYCVDRYEGSLALLMADDTLEPWSPFTNPGDELVVALSVAGATPQGFITQTQAADACALAGKRLCTDAEWIRACEGESGTWYPYGDDWIDGACNDERMCHPVTQYFGSGENWVWSELGHPCISQLPEGLATCGAHDACVTAEGVFDLVGNLHEWTADPTGTFRGGFYVDTLINGTGCDYATTAHNVQHWDYSTGFRCCSALL